MLMVVYGTLQFKEQKMAPKEDKEAVEEMTSMGQSTTSHTTSNDDAWVSHGAAVAVIISGLLHLGLAGVKAGRGPLR